LRIANTNNPNAEVDMSLSFIFVTIAVNYCFCKNTKKKLSFGNSVLKESYFTLLMRRLLKKTTLILLTRCILLCSACGSQVHYLAAITLIIDCQNESYRFFDRGCKLNELYAISRGSCLKDFVVAFEQ